MGKDNQRYPLFMLQNYGFLDNFHPLIGRCPSIVTSASPSATLRGFTQFVYPNFQVFKCQIIKIFSSGPSEKYGLRQNI